MEVKNRHNFLLHGIGVGIATGYGQEVRGSIPGKGKIVFLSTASRPTLGVHTPFSGYGGSFPGVKRTGRNADHSPPSSADVKDGYIFMTLYLIN
jgi:hypothetical protein